MSTAPAPPDLIFYDMFSSKTSGDQWTLEVFRQLFDACAGRAAELFTYTCSTANRAALLAAGFYVARAVTPAGKEETTIALTPAALGTLLPAVTNCSLRSGSAAGIGRAPSSLPKVPREERPAFEQQILRHKQFR